MALAGAERIYAMMDAPSETDDGYVTLVNAKYDKDNNLVETKERTGVWAWKHPHHDGTLTYTKLEGDIRFFDVDFGYKRARPPSPTSSTASTTSRTARSATTASTSARSKSPICAARWASCCRTPTCSPAP